MSRDPEEDFEAAVDALAERVATCHERVGCPRCSAPVGHRCRSMPRGYRADGSWPGWTLKHSHDERLRADGIPRR